MLHVPFTFSNEHEKGRFTEDVNINVTIVLQSNLKRLLV